MLGLLRRRRERSEATAEAKEFIGTIRRTLVQFGADDDSIRVDFYLAGYIQSVVEHLCSPLVGRRLTTNDKGMVFIAAWEANGTSGEWATEQVLFLLRKENPSFLKGSEDGLRPLLLRLNMLKPSAYDADVKSAIADSAHRQNFSEQRGGDRNLTLNEAASVFLHAMYLQRHYELGSVDKLVCR